MDEARPDRTSDGIRELMTNVVKGFNKSMLEDVTYSHLLRFSNMPRLMFDKYFKEATEAGLVYRNDFSLVKITEKGLLYAEENDIVSV